MKRNQWRIGRGVRGCGALALMAGILTLGGCATPQAVQRASGDAQDALARSETNARQLAAERKARETLAADLDARLKSLGENQAVLRRQLAATDARLASDEARYRRQFAQLRTDTAVPATAAATPASGDDFMAELTQRVREAAKHAYQSPPKVPQALISLDFPAYQRLAFHGKVPDWPSASPLQMSFYPAGYLFHHPVGIYLLKNGKPVALKFSPADFNFDADTAKQLTGDVPLAGFSLYYPFTPGHGTDEFLSFLGASYFRALGKGQAWGLSARGLAVDTAVAHHAEEFPYFRDFWIVPPKPGSDTLSFYARLDSPSFTGAYHFVVHPGPETTVDVNMVLFVRKPVKRLGIAPLTSMYLQGRDGGPRYDPLIRAAHDSDGLSIETLDGRWLWVPLRDPKRLLVDQIPIEGVKGFGLMQRSRHYDDYQAWGMEYQKRPSAWVTPTGGDWGKGHIVLVELPTRTQTNDNITAFWTPAAVVKPGQSLSFSYRIAWQGDQQTEPPLGHVISTRYGKADGSLTYVVNFRGGDLDNLPSWIKLDPDVRIDGGGEILKAWTAKNAATGAWRLEFTVKLKGDGPLRVKADLAYDKRPLTETWEAVLPHD